MGNMDWRYREPGLETEEIGIEVIWGRLRDIGNRDLEGIENRL